MTDLFSRLDAPPATATATPAPAIPTSGRRPTLGESACNRCGFAACFFGGATPWCWACVPANFLPGGQ